MALEIERKFLIAKDTWRNETGTMYRQGYLNSDKQRNVRVRTVGDKGYLTIKGVARGAVRVEYEYDIPVTDAEAMLEGMCQKPIIEKKRYEIRYKGHTWEVDEFFGENQGLIIAEVEMESEDERIIKPEWVGEEVTGDQKYFNASLIHHPFNTW